MENIELYKECSFLPMRDAEIILKEFSSNLTWSENENILDVGCGPGDVTTEILYPQLPSSARLIGVDINLKSVESAKKNYSSKKIHFMELDFSTKNITDVFREEQFSTIFSFYCFMWIKDLQQAIKNLRTLLKPGGQFLISTAPSSFKLYHVYAIMSKMDEWKNYMTNVDNYVSLSADTYEELQQLLTSEGLTIVRYKKQNNTFTFPNLQTCTRLYKALNPFMKGMSEQTREQYMVCLIELLKKHGVITECESGEAVMHYPTLIFYGRRPISADNI